MSLKMRVSSAGKALRLGASCGARHNTLSAGRLGIQGKKGLFGNLSATALQHDGNHLATIRQLTWQRANNLLATHPLPMDRKFEIHENPNRSRLEEWRTEIIAMRSQNWPYHRIAKWLDDEHGLAVSKEAVRKFCRVRCIRKEVPSPSEAPDRQMRRIRQHGKENPFTFDEADAGKAIEIHRR